MHHHSNLEALAADRTRSRFAEAEQSRLAHGAQANARTARTTRGNPGSKKQLWLGAPHRTDDTPTIRRQRRAS
jgi:hypothetical protein